MLCALSRSERREHFLSCEGSLALNASIPETLTILACRWHTPANPNSCSCLCNLFVAEVGLELQVWNCWCFLYRLAEPGFGCLTSLALCCYRQMSEWLMLTAALPTFSQMKILAPVVVFHRLHNEWEVGPELPFPRRIRDSQLVNIILSYVHSELKLQRGRRLFYHRNNKLHVR